MTAQAQFRAKFPLLAKTVYQKPLVYFDNGATTQKPNTVIDAYNHFYCHQNANVHRASHAISTDATQAFEDSRIATQRFINAKSPKEIIWTSGTTQGINLVANSWGSFLKEDDEVIISVAEHHANIVPWQMICEATGASLIPIAITESGIIDIGQLKSKLSNKTKIVAINHISNVTGKVNPIEKVIQLAKSVGAKTLIDGAQAIAHIKVDVQALDCDFYLFSSHKMFGPTGLGVLYAKQAILERMPVYQTGGEMIKSVSLTKKTTFNELPFKFEPGTPNIAAVIAFHHAINLIECTQQLIEKQDAKLSSYLYEKLTAFPQISMLFTGRFDIPLCSFVVQEHHSLDLASYLDTQGIAVRTGHHCAMPLMEHLAIDSCIRVSLAPYNTFEEIDFFVDVLSTYFHQEKQTSQEIIQNQQNNTKVDIVKALFLNAKSWDKKHREIMLLGKSFQRMDKTLRTEHSLIAGCESKAWLVAQQVNGKFVFEADSDAKIVRGLLEIVLGAYQNKSAEEILVFDIKAYFTELGLLNHLSPSRGNGLLAIVERIQHLVKT